MKTAKTDIKTNIEYHVTDYGGDCGRFKLLKDARKCKREFAGSMAEIIKHSETFILIKTQERIQ